MKIRLRCIATLIVISLLIYLNPVKAQNSPTNQSKPLLNPAITPLGLGNGLHAEYFYLGGTQLILWTDSEGPINHGLTTGCAEFYNNHTIYQNECAYWTGNWDSSGRFEEYLTGYIEAPLTGNYEFHALIDDYLEISINGVSDLVDGAGLGEYSIQTYLVQGHFYPITMHYKNREGTNNLALFWTLPDLSYAMVPKTSLYAQIPVLGNGNGLFARYYDVNGLSLLQTVYGEGPINHGWNESCIYNSFTFYQDVCGLWANSYNSGTSFMEVLTGTIEAPVTGHYIFHSWIDDYLDITINDVNQVVDNLSGDGYSIELDLVQGQFYPISMRFANRMGTNNLSLRWETTGISYSLVPRMYLYMENPYLPADFGKMSPVDESTDRLLNPTLTWSQADGTVQYEYCYYSTDASDCEGTWLSTGLNSITLSGLELDTTYHWQVRATNDAGGKDADEGAWWTFTTHNDTSMPVVTDFILLDPNPTEADAVRILVIFSEPVTGVDWMDFIHISTGLSGGEGVTGVEGLSTEWMVTLSTGTTGTGWLSLMVIDDDTIRDAHGNPLGGVGDGNGQVSADESYLVRPYRLYLPLQIK
jgi:hypothetical protein